MEAKDVNDVIVTSLKAGASEAVAGLVAATTKWGAPLCMDRWWGLFWLSVHNRHH